MSLDLKQQFIKKNFEKHARLTARVIVETISLPPTRQDLEDRVFVSIIAFMSEAFKSGKIIVKNNPAWDLLENG